MVDEIDLIAEIEERILEKIKEMEPSTSPVKLMSERKIAKMLTVPQSRVHQAIQRLIHQGVLYSRQGAGTYINIDGISEFNHEMEDFLYDTAVPHTKELQTIKLLVCGVPSNKLWDKLFADFHDEYPFVEIDANRISERDIDDISYDIIIHSTYDMMVNRQHFRPIDIADLTACGTDIDKLCPDILDVCKVDGELLGMPITRTTAVLYANTALMEKYGITAGNIVDSYDMLRIGAELEKETGGEIRGTRYLGFIYQSLLEGIMFENIGNNRVTFDTEKVSWLLETIKPLIKKHQMKVEPLPQTAAFMRGEYLFFQDFLSTYTYLQQSNLPIEPIPVPKKTDGASCEWMYLGSINRDSKHHFEATLLLSYLSGYKAQKQLYSITPQWLSVNRDILELQEKNTPFIQGAVNFDFNKKSYYTQTDVDIWQFTYKLHIELAKYFMNLQSLKQTIQTLTYFKKEV